MEFRILGPLEAEADGRLLSLGPPKQRVLLALLLLHANRVVSRDRLQDALWGEHPPPTAPTALHGYISALRKELGAARLERRSPGYLLHSERDELDLERFERLVGEARALDAPDAAERLREAIGLWRGRPLDDLGSAPFLEAERRRLDEIRLGAIEERIDADLALGRHRELIAELDALLRAQPHRERLRGQLMLALYRSGRQAEALEAYREGRKRLAEELGLEPGEPLRRLERAILEQDPALGPSAPAPAAPAATQPRRRITRSRRGITAAAFVVAGVIAGVAAVFTGGSGAAVRPNSIAVIDPGTGGLVGDVRLGGRPFAVAVSGRAVWAADPANRLVYRIDPQTRKVADKIEVGTHAHDLASGFGSIWVAGGTDGTVQQIDASTDVVKATIPLGPEGASARPVFWVAAGAGAVWATSGKLLYRIDPATAKVISRVMLPAWPTGLAAGDGAVWVVTEDQQLLKFVPSTRGISGPVGPFDLRAGGLAPTVGAGSVWLILYRGRGVVQAVDPDTLAGEPPVSTTDYPLDIAVGAGWVWAVDVHGSVIRINPRTSTVVARAATTPTIRSSIAAGAGAVWVAIQTAD